MEKNSIIKYEGGLILHVQKAISITRKLLANNRRRLKIIYLDDHLSYSKSVAKSIIKIFPNASFKYFQNGTNALAYTLNCLFKKEKIDLIITDVMHPGLNGVAFSEYVRIKESDYNQKIPFLFITMHSDRSIVNRIESITNVKYLSRQANSEEVYTAMRNLI